MDKFTPSEFQQMQQYFFTGATSGYSFRKEQLLRLREAVQKYESKILDALFKDLHKSKEEAFSTEVGFIYAELSHTLKNLKSWMQPVKVSTPAFLFPSSSYLKRESLGICLIIAPWNYPFHLLMAPLIGAIAGGNCVVLKPSEISAHTSAVVKEMMEEFFDKKYLAIVEGDGGVVVPQMMNLNRFDHVFFTGSIPVGREIAEMAARRLVPVTLELGGKSPCIVDEDVDIKVAARRITWGKFTNAGQTCVAPDYLLIHEKNKDTLIAEMRKSILQFYGEDPLKSYDYGRIINERRFEKLESYLHQGKVLEGGRISKQELYISPTIMEGITANAAVMEEEIFGPILPVLTFKQPEEALSIIRHNPHPLSLYYFGNNLKNQKLFMDNIQFGGGCINNTLVHLANSYLPFGGVGSSGVGAYHGKFSFETFTRVKSIVKTGTWADPSVKYPPYQGKLKFLQWMIR